MKKDFSQPFNIDPAFVEVIIQDDVTKKYALLRSRDDWEKDFSSVFTPKLDDRPMAIQVIAYLDGLGYDVVRLRELARQTEVSYSFSDDTPGSLSDSVCMLVVVNRTDHDKKNIGDQSVEWVDAVELIEAMHASPHLVPIIELGLESL